jgi:hypothetical protein
VEEAVEEGEEAGSPTIPIVSRFSGRETGLLVATSLCFWSHSTDKWQRVRFPFADLWNRRRACPAGTSYIEIFFAMLPLCLNLLSSEVHSRRGFSLPKFIVFA